MKNTADLQALLTDINAEVAVKRAEEEAARVAEAKKKIEVVMQLLPLVTAHPKAADAVREQMRSVPAAKTAVLEHLRKEFLGFSGPFLPHTAAQIATAVGGLAEVSAEKFAEIRKKNEAVYEHRKTAHEGKWQNGCSDCALMFTYDSKADGTLHRYIALTHWARQVMKERYDRKRPPMVPKGKDGAMSLALKKAEEEKAEAALDKAEADRKKAELEKAELDKAEADRKKAELDKAEADREKVKKGRPTSRSRGGAHNLTLEAQNSADSNE